MQPDDSTAIKKACLKKCLDPRCDEKNSLQLCDGIASCYWCEKNKDSILLDKPYCASADRCFRGKESTTKQSDGKVISQPLVNAYACFVTILKFYIVYFFT